MACVLAPALRTLLSPTLSSLASTAAPPLLLDTTATAREAAAALNAPGVSAVLVATGRPRSREGHRVQGTGDAPGVSAVLVATGTASTDHAAERPGSADVGADEGGGGGGDAAAPAAPAPAIGFELFTPGALLEAVVAESEGGDSLDSMLATSISAGVAPLMPPASCSVIDALHMLQVSQTTLYSISARCLHLLTG